MQTDNNNLTTIRIWDIPVRLFHWSLAISVVAMFITDKADRLDVHIIFGHIICALLLTRIGWGFWGSENLRFTALVFRPQAYASYLKTLFRREPSYGTGHSPIGSLAVIIILTMLLIQVCTGMIATDVDGLKEGSYAYYVPYELSRFASEIHVDVEEIIKVLIPLHIAAGIFYLVYKKDNLIKPMIKGVRQVPQSQANNQPQFAPLWRSLTIMIAAFAISFLGYFFFG